MLTLTGSRRLYLARSHQDMRRGIDALAAVIRGEFGSDPTTGDAFIFLSRDCRRMKVLVYESGGYWLGMKRLDRGTFARPGVGTTAPGPVICLSAMELHALLEGIDIQVVRRRARKNVLKIRG